MGDLLPVVSETQTCTARNCEKVGDVYCNDCVRIFCNSHIQIHDDLHFDHRLTEVVHPPPCDQLCATHTIHPIVFACIQCYTPMCQLCIDATSTENTVKHTPQAINSVVERCRTDLKTKMTNLKTKRSNVEDTLQKLQNNLNFQLWEERENFENTVSIKSHCDGLTERKVRLRAKRRKSQLERVERDTERFQTSCREVLDELNKLQEEQDVTVLLRQYIEYSDRLQLLAEFRFIQNELTMGVAEEDDDSYAYESEAKRESADPLEALIEQFESALQTSEDLGDLEKKAGSVADKLYKAKNWEKALYYYKKQYEIRCDMYGDDALIEALATVLFDMGYCCNELKRFKEAEGYYSKSLDGRKEAFGEESEKCALCYNNLGFALNKMSRYREAREKYIRAVEIRTKINPAGFTSNNLVGGLSKLGSICSSMSKFQESIDWYTREYEMRLKMSGKDAQTERIADVLFNLGFNSNKLKQYEKALDYYSRSLEMYKVVWKDQPLHNDIDVGHFNLGCTYENLKKYDESVSFFKKCKDIRESRYGSTSHDKVKAVYKAIANVMDKVPEMKEEAKEWREKSK